MRAAAKIMQGLREALAHARGDGRHEWTYWAPRENDHGWTRVCTKCKVRETTLVITDEIRSQT